jgi:hypothetical protein
MQSYVNGKLRVSTLLSTINSNIDKTNTENDCARAFAYLENKYPFILIIMI